MNSGEVALIIMLICIVLFVTEALPTATTALLGCTAMFVFDICSLQDIMCGFTNDITLILFGMGIFGTSMFASGLSTMAGRAVVKLLKDNERKLIFITGIIVAFLSGFVTNQVICVMVMAIGSAVVKANPKIEIKNIILPIVLCVIYGGSATLIGAAAQLSASSILQEATGTGFSMFLLTPIGAGLTVICVLFVTFIAYPLGKKIWGTREPGKVLEEDIFQNTVIDKKKVRVTLIAWFTMILLMLTEWVSVGAAAMIGGLICIIGKAVDQKTAFREMDWNVIIWLACCMGLAKGLSNSGATKILADLIISVLADANPLIFFSAMVLFAMILSNFIANTTTVVIILPVVLAIVQSKGLNPVTFAVGITFGAGLTFCTPLANGFVGMTMNCGYKFKDYFKYTFLLAIISWVLITIVTPIVFPIVL